MLFVKTHTQVSHLFFLNISINNNSATSNDISSSNPLYIEIYVEGEKVENKNLITE